MEKRANPHYRVSRLVQCAGLATFLSCCTWIPSAGQRAIVTGVVPYPGRHVAHINDPFPNASACAPIVAGPREYSLSLAEAKSRVLQTHVVMEMASHQLSAKHFAWEAARKDFLPKLLNSYTYLHFDSDLGTVVTTPGIFNPVTSIAVPVLDQDSSFYTAAAIQPITPLLKVREAVNISAADAATAEAQQQLAHRELAKGTEQLYLGLHSAQRIRAGLRQAHDGAEQFVDSTHSSDARITLVEVQQYLATADTQVATLTEQLNQLVGLPTGTELRLEDPPLPKIPFGAIDDAVKMAVACSPKIREANLQVEKAEAAVRLAQADHVPDVMAYGFYVNQNSMPVIQNDITGVGMSASFTFEWGKKNNVLNERQSTLMLAQKFLQKERQDLELSAAKAFHEAHRTEQSLAYARQLLQLNLDATLPTDPFQLKFAVKDRLNAELGVIKAELDYRSAIVELCSLTGP